MIDRFPVSKESRESLKKFYARRDNVFEGKTEAEVSEILSGISYTSFLKKYGGLTDEAANLFIKTTHGYAYDYLDLGDPDWPEGQAPHEIARLRFGNIDSRNRQSHWSIQLVRMHLCYQANHVRASIDE
jgi:hypothetical protein